MCFRKIRSCRRRFNGMFFFLANFAFCILLKSIIHVLCTWEKKTTDDFYIEWILICFIGFTGWRTARFVGSLRAKSVRQKIRRCNESADRIGKSSTYRHSNQIEIKRLNAAAHTQTLNHKRSIFYTDIFFFIKHE